MTVMLSADFESTSIAAALATQAVETEEFRVFLDHIPIAIVISKLVRGDQRIVYANKAYEALTGQRVRRKSSSVQGTRSA